MIIIVLVANIDIHSKKWRARGTGSSHLKKISVEMRNARYMWRIICTLGPIIERDKKEEVLQIKGSSEIKKSIHLRSSLAPLLSYIQREIVVERGPSLLSSNKTENLNATVVYYY